MPTLLITIPFGITARNILRSEAFPLLCQRLSVVILSPFADNPAFRREFGRKNVFFEKLVFQGNLGTKILNRVLDPVESYLFTKKTKIETLVFLRDQLKRENPWRYFKIKALALALDRQPLLSWLRLLNFKFLDVSYYRQIFQKHKVDAVFITNPFNALDQQVAICAQRAGIALIGMPHSWDNITSKSGVRQGSSLTPGKTIPLRFDRVIAWNSVLRQELMDFLEYRDEEIFISGIPQFDFYARPERLTPREEFLSAIGADPKKKLILHAVGSPTYVAHPDQITQILIEIIKSGQLTHPAQLLVRYHPHRSIMVQLQKLEDQYKHDPDIFFEKPSSAYMALSDIAWNAQANDEYELANAITASDVVVSMGSTIALDCAALDKPLINLAFDGYQDEPYFNSIKRIYAFTHYKKIVATGGFKLANNRQELVNYLNRYLEDPTLEVQERKTLMNLECHKIDGQAGKRIAEFLFGYLNCLPQHNHRQNRSFNYARQGSN